ncbi:MAG: SDR family NAD(P)-dependent oxidoreductase [Anaerolineae bacterium]
MGGHSLFDLTGRVALVTGAAGNLGGNMVTGLAGAGADLMLVDVDGAGLERMADVVRGMGRRAACAVADVSEPEQIRAAFAELDRAFGRIDVLANVVGYGYLGRPEEVPLEEVAKVAQSLLVGRFCCCQEAGRRMLAAGGGSIINIGSLASITALGRGHVAYSMGMGATAQLTRELSTEWASRGVRVNAILCAQMVNPGLTERMAADPMLRETYLSGIPMGRLGQGEDIQGLAIFLASDASCFVTGALIPLDGGNLAKNAGGSHPAPMA